MGSDENGFSVIWSPQIASDDSKCFTCVLKSGGTVTPSPKKVGYWYSSYICSFHPCNIYRDCPRAHGGQNVPRLIAETDSRSVGDSHPSCLKPRSDWQVFGASFLAPENLCKLHVYTTQVFCSRKWLYAFEKSDLQSIVQSAAEFHDRNLPELEHVLFRPVSGASFLYQKNVARNTVHTSN